MYKNRYDEIEHVLSSHGLIPLDEVVEIMADRGHVDIAGSCTRANVQRWLATLVKRSRVRKKIYSGTRFYEVVKR
jgi:hypothetical protein